MIENRQRSDNRTVCPDGRTFGLVAGAFGRLRCGDVGKSGTGYRRTAGGENAVSWKEEIAPIEDGPAESSKVDVTPVDKLQQLLQLQLQLFHQEGWPREIKPTIDMYNRVLKRLAVRSGDIKSQRHASNEASAAEQALLWLRFMKSPTNAGGVVCEPDRMSYAHVISALASYRSPQQSEVEGDKSRQFVPIYEPMEELAKKLHLDIDFCMPQHISHQWSLNEAENLLRELEDRYNGAENDGTDKHHLKCVLAYGYQCVLQGWGRCAVSGDRNDDNKEDAINRANELLERLESLASVDDTDHNIEVPSSCYSSVILALSVSNHPSSATSAENVLKRMIEQWGQRKEDQPASYFSRAFSGCIAAHAKNKDAPKAEKILNQMIELYDSVEMGWDFVPEARAFGTCIALWSKYSPSSKGKSRGKDENPSYQQRLHNADRAEAILSELESIAQVEARRGNRDFLLEAQPFNIAILARVQTIPGQPRNEHGGRDENEEVILHAQSILDHMEYELGVAPDPYTYSILLNSWCRQASPGEYGERAAEYADELLRRRIEDVDIDKIYGDGRGAEKSHKWAKKEIWPNVKHYSSVLKAHARTKSPGGARKALALLSEMERRFYNANVVEDADNIPEGCDYHVDQKDVAKPDLICYSIVMDAFSNSRLPDASNVALRLLNAVEAKYEAGDDSMKPNTRIYTAAISSLIHSSFTGDEEDSENPSNMTNAQRAWSILERMKKNGVVPNSFTYNNIINCASEAGQDANEQRVAFEIAIRAFQELRLASGAGPASDECNVDLRHPNSYTFAFMLKACQRLLPDGSLRKKVMAQTFKECCKSGCLNDAVLDRLYGGTDPDLFYELVMVDPSPANRKKGAHGNGAPVQANELPLAWSRCCNIDNRNRGRRKPSNGRRGTKY